MGGVAKMCEAPMFSKNRIILLNLFIKANLW